MNPLWQKIKDWHYIASGRAKRDALAKACRQRMEADRIRRDIPADIEGYRQKFKRNLLGNWLTNYAYYGPFPLTEWQFFEDGTALELYSSVMSGNTKTRYLWRELEDFSIELLELETESDAEDEDELSGDEEEDELPIWSRRSYDFKIDDGSIVLFETPENEDFKFGMSSEYLIFVGDHSKEKREE